MVSGSCGYVICAAPPYLNSTSSRSPHQGQGINTLVRHGRGAVLVDERAAAKSFQGKGRVERMGLSIRDRMRVNPAGAWCRLEPAGAPSTVENRLEQLGDQRLQWVALNGELQANHLGQNRGVTSRAERHLAGGDETAVGVHADHPIALEVKAGDLAVLNQVDPHLIGLAGE